MDFGPAGNGRMLASLAVLALLALSAGITMQPDRFRSLTWVLLAFFAVRVLLGRARSR